MATRSKRLPWPDTSYSGYAYWCPVVAQMSLGVRGKSQDHKDKDALWARLLVIGSLLSFLPIHPGVS